MHFGEDASPMPPPQAYPWFSADWAQVHARHVAYWAGRRVWPSCRPESKLAALNEVERQLREYHGLGRPVPGQGPPSSRVLLLLKSPSRRQANFPASVANSSACQQVSAGLLGSGTGVYVMHIFPFYRGDLWDEADVPVSAAEAFELYVKAAIRILSPKVVLCPGRYVAQYARAACRAKNIGDVPDTPYNEFIRVIINRTPTHILRIPHPFQTSDRCEGSSLQRRIEYGDLLREGLAHVKKFVTVSREPIDATALLMRGQKVPLGSRAASASAPLPGIDEPGHFQWVADELLATMDQPANKRQVARLCQHRRIRLVVNLAPKPHPRSWFSGIDCDQIHCPIPDDGGAPSTASARQACDAARKAMRQRRAVAVHRTYGPGATSLFVECLKTTMRLRGLGRVEGYQGPTPVQRVFLEVFASEGEDAESRPGTESMDPIEESSPPRKRRKLRPSARYAVWLIDGHGRHFRLERGFETEADAEAFTRRGNRALARTADERSRLRETTGLLGAPLRRAAKLYFLSSGDVDVYEIRGAGKVLKRRYGKPDDPSAFGSRPRRDRENGRLDIEQWNQYSRGLVAEL